MENLTTHTVLRERILELERKRFEEGKFMKQQFHLAYESIKPINLIKNTFREVAASQDLRDNLLNTSVGLAAGYASKTLFEDASRSPFKKLMGTVLLFGITNIVARHPKAIKSLGMMVLNVMRQK
jgi:hypothetical protein